MSGHCFCHSDYSPAYEQTWYQCCRCRTITYDPAQIQSIGPDDWVPGGEFGLPKKIGPSYVQRLPECKP